MATSYTEDVGIRFGSPFPLKDGVPISAAAISVGVGGAGGPQGGPAARLEWNCRGGMKGNQADEILIYSTAQGFVGSVSATGAPTKYVVLGPGDIWEIDEPGTDPASALVS